MNVNFAYDELWKNPDYMIVSQTPLYIDARIDIQKELIDELIIAKGANNNYFLNIFTEVSRIFGWHNIKFNVDYVRYGVSSDKIHVGNNIEQTYEPYRKYLIDSSSYETVVNILFVDINNTETNLGKAFSMHPCEGLSIAITQVGHRARWDYKYAALIVAHEVGHLLGFVHVDETNTTCKCPWSSFKCVMKPKTYAWNLPTPTSFDSCNLKNLLNSLPSCLLDHKRSLFNPNDPVCGNNILEEGEQCDCGFEEACLLTKRRQCCDPSTCKLIHQDFDCDEGTCCKNCKFSRGTVCRPSANECDLTDYCPGDSHWCIDFHRADGIKCANNSAVCVEGECMTKNKYCEKLFPKTSPTYSNQCYSLARYFEDKNCENINSENLKNLFCGTGKGICGQVYCNGPIQQEPFYRFSVGSTSCYTLLDDSLHIHKNKVPYGGMCGEEKVCVHGECIEASDIQSYCWDPCKKYEECSTLGACAPNDQRWFTTHEGYPNKPQ